MAPRSPLMNVTVNAVLKAARQLRRDFVEVEQLQVGFKGPANFVSEADMRAQETLFQELTRGRPDWGFTGEESGHARSMPAGGSRWIVDPLDGTTNFLHGIPHFCISVAAEVEGELTTAVVYDPTRDELFWAERGRGAFLNQRRLRVSGRRQLKEALIGTGIPFLGWGQHDRFQGEIGRVMGQVAGIRRMGAAALDLAWVAAARLDGFWERDLHPWDVAAGILLIREAGGFATEIGGGKQALEGGSIVAANDHLIGPLDTLLAGPQITEKRAVG
ncbi:MAG: inositol monophosphatase [Alphaproteobacteria bacterium]|nr:inositol monophosphatase [Alphaproteobacteria bacterium]